MQVKFCDKGKWAVAITGKRGWKTDCALGMITEAKNALVTRCSTKQEAEELAARLNAEQPRPTPGCNLIPVFEAMAYNILDYISKQQLLTNQTRDCDRRLA